VRCHDPLSGQEAFEQLSYSLVSIRDRLSCLQSKLYPTDAA
jgi:hypothetical protein